MPTQIILGIPCLSVYAKGKVNADGSEQKLVKIHSLMKFSGYVDLSKMEAGDVVIIRQYIKIKPRGKYGLYGQETYVGVQIIPLVYVTPKVLAYGVEVTLEQTQGTPKSFDFLFIREG